MTDPMNTYRYRKEGIDENYQWVTNKIYFANEFFFSKNSYQFCFIKISVVNCLCKNLFTDGHLKSGSRFKIFEKTWQPSCQLVSVDVAETFQGNSGLYKETFCEVGDFKIKYK